MSLTVKIIPLPKLELDEPVAKDGEARFQKYQRTKRAVWVQAVQSAFTSVVWEVHLCHVLTIPVTDLMLVSSMCCGSSRVVMIASTLIGLIVRLHVGNCTIWWFIHSDV